MLVGAARPAPREDFEVSCLLCYDGARQCDTSTIAFIMMEQLMQPKTVWGAAINRGRIKNKRIGLRLAT